MPKDVVMPKASLTMTEGTLTEWIKKDGEEVKAGEEIALIETDKVVLPVEAETAGTLVHALEKGQMVPVATIIGYILFPGEDRNSIEQIFESDSVEKEEHISSPLSQKQNKTSQKVEVKVSPLARKVAKDLGVEMEDLLAAGLQGKISAEDVKRVAKAKEKLDEIYKHPAETSFDLSNSSGTILNVVPLSGVRGLIANRMSASAQTSAAVTLHTVTDASSLIRIRALLNDHIDEINSQKTSYDAIFVRAVALSLRNHRRLNSRMFENRIEELSPIHIAVAVDTPRELCTVVIKDADKKPLNEITKELNALVVRALEGKSQIEDLEGSTFSITNLGMYNITDFTPIILPNQCAILGIGAFTQILDLHNEHIVQKQMLPLSLTFDHRIVDGAPAARFLKEVSDRIRDAELLLL